MLRDESCSPLRQKRSKLVVKSEFLRTLEIALGTPDLCGVLVLFDADDDPTCELAFTCQEWVAERNPQVPCHVTIATKEYEAWFLGSIESLRGFRGIAEAAQTIPYPEGIRDAKGALSRQMVGSRKYTPTVDQAAFTAIFDLKLAHQNCRSFRKLVKSFAQIIPDHLRGSDLPPAGWLNQ